MPATQEDLFTRLTVLGLAHRTVEHPAVFTVEESRSVKQEMPGGHSKNLFLKDKAGVLSLAVAWAETKVDLKGLGKTLGARQRLSFGKPELMTEVLGVEPGSVTPFALINDQDLQVTNVIVDQKLFEFDPVWFHPLQNTASTAIAPDDLVAFIKACGHVPKILPLEAPLSP